MPRTSSLQPKQRLDVSVNAKPRTSSRSINVMLKLQSVEDAERDVADVEVVDVAREAVDVEMASAVDVDVVMDHHEVLHEVHQEVAPVHVEVLLQSLLMTPVLSQPSVHKHVIVAHLPGYGLLTFDADLAAILPKWLVHHMTDVLNRMVENFGIWNHAKRQRN